MRQLAAQRTSRVQTIRLFDHGLLAFCCSRLAAIAAAFCRSCLAAATAAFCVLAWPPLPLPLPRHEHVWQPAQPRLRRAF